MKFLFQRITETVQLYAKKWVSRKIKKEVFVEEVLGKAFPDAEPIPFLKVSGKRARLNLIVSHLSEESLYGTLGSVCILAVSYANVHHIDLRIISRSQESRPDLFFKFLEEHQIDRPEKTEFFSDYDRKRRRSIHRLEISDQDVFFATCWQTRKALLGLHLGKPYYYFVRKAPAWGAAVDPLAHMIKENALIPAFPKALYYAPREQLEPKERCKLFFYCRPSLPEKLFLNGLQLLNEAFSRGLLDPLEWEIYFAGEKTPAIVFSNGVKPKSLGRLSIKNYFSFIRTVDLGICFENSDLALNRVAFDVAACGGVVLTNDLKGQGFANMIETSLEPEDYMEGLKSALNLIKNPKIRRQNYSESPIPRNWEIQIQPLVAKMDF